MTQGLSWLGNQVGNYIIEHVLGDGPFATVFSGTDLDNNRERAFKVSKPADLLSRDSATGIFPTRAIAEITGGTIEFTPDTQTILSLQYRKLKSCSNQGYVAVHDFTDLDGISYYSMDVIPGFTGRQLIANSRITLKQLIALARCLDHLSKSETFEYHGDLKPDNVIFDGTRVTLIDPGYFGTLFGDGAEFPGAAITTAAYYPTLLPDDMLALGLMLWEATFGVHPLARKSFSGESNLARSGPKLVEAVRMQETVGKYFLSPLLDLPLPSEVLPEITDEVERFLLKALRLEKLPSGVIELNSGFNSYSALAGAMLAFDLKGMEYLIPIDDQEQS